MTGIFSITVYRRQSCKKKHFQVYSLKRLKLFFLYIDGLSILKEEVNHINLNKQLVYQCIIYEFKWWLSMSCSEISKDMDVNELEKISNSTIIHKLK